MDFEMGLSKLPIWLDGYDDLFFFLIGWMIVNGMRIFD
jgi:hypothetical protein